MDQSFPSLFVFLVHLVCNSQEIILQRHHLPPVLCNASLKSPSFHHFGTVSVLKISSSMPWTPRWRKDLCRMHSSSLSPGANVQGWTRWEGEYLDGGSSHKSFMLDHWGGQNMILKETSREMVFQSAMLTVEQDSWSQWIYYCPSCTLQWRSHTPIQMFHLLKHLFYLLSHLLVLWVAVAEQWWDLHVDTEERYWIRPKAHRTSGPESGWSIWCLGGFSATKIADVYKLCCLPEAAHLGVLSLPCSLFLLLANLLKEKPVTSL